jgi:Leucine-rich repeat (LRR) protein
MHSIFFYVYLVGFQVLQPMRLGKLENLDLSGNDLNSSILSILSGLSSLKSLDLSNNKLTGSGMIHSFFFFFNEFDFEWVLNKIIRRSIIEYYN